MSLGAKGLTGELRPGEHVESFSGGEKKLVSHLHIYIFFFFYKLFCKYGCHIVKSFWGKNVAHNDKYPTYITSLHVWYQQNRQCRYNVTLRCVRATIVAGEKQYLLHILSVCLQIEVAGMQCACAILSSVACPALNFFFPHYLIKGPIFEKRVTEYKLCFFYFLYNFCSRHFSI